MYRESYIPDGPTSKYYYDHVVGATYYINEKGRRNYNIPQDKVPHGVVPPDDESRGKTMLRILYILFAIVLAVLFTSIYLLIKSFSHV